MATGSSRWWDCPLDAQRLAEESVDAVVRAAREVTQYPGHARGEGGGSITSTPQLVRGAFETIAHMRVDGSAIYPWGDFSGFFAASDGFVRLHGNYPHHAEAIRRALGISSREELRRAAGRLDAQQVEESVVGAGGIAARVRTEEEWMAHPQHAATAHEPWVRVYPGPDRSPAHSAGRAPSAESKNSGSPLAGIRVLDFTRVIAGPTCTQLLACLGAEVLRIDPPHRPELLDQYLSNRMGKRSVALDLREPEHRRTVAELISGADVVVLGYRPGSLDRFGLDVDDLAEDHSGLIVASLSAWGESGPFGSRAGFDSIVQAASGIASRCAASDGPPGALPVQALDFSTGYQLAAAIMGLLSEHRGGTVRATLLGAARRLLSYRTPENTPGDPHSASGMPDDDTLRVDTVRVDSPHGEVTLPPPPLLVNGRTIEHAIGGYGQSIASW